MNSSSRPRAETSHLSGTKELAYALAKDPWSALAELPFRIARSHGLVEGLFLRRPSQAHAPHTVPIEGSPDTPTTILAMVSAGEMFFRVLFQTHLWSFGAPDYPAQSPIEIATLVRCASTTGPQSIREQSFFEVPVSSRDNPERISCVSSNISLPKSKTGAF